MALSQEDLEELEHHQKMYHARKKMLYILEEQEASYGLDVPPHIVNQMDKLTKQIQQHKQEIDLLERVAVQDQDSLSEVEYRVVLAEEWNTQRGYPTVVGQTKLEFARLRLHIKPEIAKQMEWKIRRELAIERINYLKLSTEDKQMCQQLISELHAHNYKWNSTLEYKVRRLFVSVIRLHPIEVLHYIFLRTMYGMLSAIDRETIIKYKNRWFQFVMVNMPDDEIDYCQQYFHNYLEPNRAYNASEWDEVLPF